MFKLFSLVILSAVQLLASSAFAGSAHKIHVLENLSAAESRFVHERLKKMGYEPTSDALFSRSKDAFIITKILESDVEKAGIVVEFVHQENEGSLPRTVFEYRSTSSDLQAIMTAFPKPEALGPMNFMPVALQK
jgi:hypothetical protein